MRGRLPVPTHLKVIRGNPGKRRIHPEPEPAQPAEVPVAPTFLAGYSLAEWGRVAPELHRLGLLTGLDVMPLGAYCTAYGRWRLAEESIARIADGDHLSPEHRALIRVARAAVADMLRFASEFGMSPTSRTRLSVGPSKGPGRFDGLLA